MRVDWACLCGYLCFQAKIDPEMVMICHCTDCQNGTGAYRAGVIVNVQDCRLVGGGAIMAPLIGGVTGADIDRGNVQALLAKPPVPRTVFMKLATLSSLFDYIQCAMPWTAPKSLQPDVVYASIAYLLYLAGIIPGDFVLSDHTVSEVQAALPNRNGMTSDHGLWPGADEAAGGIGNGGVPDVQAVRCMVDCAVPVSQ
jgi:hypothetical protein